MQMVNNGRPGGLHLAMFIIFNILKADVGAEILWVAFIGSIVGQSDLLISCKKLQCFDLVKISY